REAANLLCHGIRSRLGRPASRSVVVWAALAAVVCGLFCAALATRAAWETARPLPARAEAVDIVNGMLPGQKLDESTYRDPALFVIYGQPFGPQFVGDLLLGD